MASTDVFINYRGVDADHVPQLLFERLSRTFGRRRVFLDNMTIGAGEDYVVSLLEGVRSAKVLLAVIGPNWFATDSAGRRLVDDPDDWIRRELVTAFAHGVRVVPVFTDGATPPRPEQLPADIRQLGRQNGLPLRRIRSGEDLDAIVRAVSTHVPSRRRRLLTVLAAVLVVAVAATLVPLLLRPDGTTSAPGPGTPVSTTSVTTTTSTTAEATTVEATTTKATTTTTSEPPAAGTWWEGTLTLDADTFTTGWSLDSSPPQRWPLGDLGLCSGDCGGTAVAGVAFAPWIGAAPPERAQCVDRLNANPGVRRLPVRAGTRGCLVTEGRRIGRLEVVGIDGPGKMRIAVTVWETPSG
ncbi:TIR domain-containing protein [Lentzea fradiae]|uniref:TIR domain-containing protein n=1 Tax=Lentzea fradiae TaxID=200378 RepID=A0A1G7X2G5_9PSEU|nr:toll/interleukin-1 receptor domain-containing protein [Lentzea fradiae]SDG78388.1 TIR domain-containing protein [Lentzea fradiae]